MTSMDFFPESARNTAVPPEWGTGKFKENTPLWTPKSATWHCSGEPVDQAYTLTNLKLSNVRLNDQLLPAPQDVDMGKLMINKPFPAEHPYSSHQPRFAVFPKFDSPEDPKRGVAARRQMPKNDEMPAQPYDIKIVSKVKGSGLRHEIQALPEESQKKPLEWHDGDFDQVVKARGERQAYYPIPPKTYVPNLVQRDDSKVIRGNMTVTPRSANVLRNVERSQWQTTYDLNHTGQGPANPMKLDNLEDKKSKFYMTGDEDDTLYPRSVPTFDPARPFEGRIARASTAPPLPQTGHGNPRSNPDYKRKQTLTEREEQRLLHGNEYASLPNTYGSGLKEPSHDSGINVLCLDNEFETVPLESGANAPHTPPDGSTKDHAVQAKQERHQQMEAENRWKVLEAQTPDHNLSARGHKMELVSSKTQPHVFYQHEGKYQRERSGLYKTSYDPSKLQYSMNKEEERGPAIMDTTKSHVDALNHPTGLNLDMAEIMQYNRTFGGVPASVAQLHNQPSQYEAFEPFNRTKRLQKEHIHPTVQSSDVRTQENGIVLKESTYGDSYNTKKFLQENILSPFARNEPLNLMSHENQNIERVRVAATPIKSSNAEEDEFGIVPDRLEISPARVDSSVRNSRVGSSQLRSSQSELLLPQTADTLHMVKLPVSIGKSRLAGSTMKNGGAFSSRASNVAPSNLRHSWAGGSAYKDQFPGSGLDMSYKRDDRFNWTAGSGVPRPQTSLLQIQDSFTQTAARRKFHQQFPESGPDLRENILSGRKHDFAGLNAQVLRGAAILA